MFKKTNIFVLFYTFFASLACYAHTDDVCTLIPLREGTAVYVNEFRRGVYATPNEAKRQKDNFVQSGQCVSFSTQSMCTLIPSSQGLTLFFNEQLIREERSIGKAVQQLQQLVNAGVCGRYSVRKKCAVQTDGDGANLLYGEPEELLVSRRFRSSNEASAYMNELVSAGICWATDLR